MLFLLEGVHYDDCGAVGVFEGESLEAFQAILDKSQALSDALGEELRAESVKFHALNPRPNQPEQKKNQTRKQFEASAEYAEWRKTILDIATRWNAIYAAITQKHNVPKLLDMLEAGGFKSVEVTRMYLKS